MYTSTLDYWYNKEYNDLFKKRDDLLDQIVKRVNTRDGQGVHEIIWEVRDLCDKLEATCKTVYPESPL